MSKHKGKFIALMVAGLALAMVAATYFGSVTVVNTMHGETNYFNIVLGNHQASVVRKISPSNVVMTINGLSIPRTNLSSTVSRVCNLLYTDATNLWVNCATGNVFYVSLTNANPALLLATNNAPGQEVTIHLVQDSTGTRTVTYDATSIKISAAIYPPITTNANAWDIVGAVGHPVTAHKIGIVNTFDMR